MDRRPNLAGQNLAGLLYNLQIYLLLIGSAMTISNVLRRLVWRRGLGEFWRAVVR